MHLTDAKQGKIKNSFIWLKLITLALVISTTLIHLLKKSEPIKMNYVTEIILTPFGFPHPYKLNYVAQYRFVHQVGEFLVRRDNHQNLIGGLAQKWEISSDRRSITFYLKPKLYSALEVSQSLKRLIKEGQTTHSNLAAQFKEEDIEVKGPLELKINTNGDAGALLSPLVMADAVILPDDHWINIKGYSEPQVDWTKTKGPYIYSSGKFPLEPNTELTFKPNENHYFFEKEQLNWKIRAIDIDSFKNISELNTALNQEPSFTTVRYSNLYKIFDSDLGSPKFYETRPNSLIFLSFNPYSKSPLSKEQRLTITKKIFTSNLDAITSCTRAYQVALPGMSGKMEESELSETKLKITSMDDAKFKKPIKWLIPSGKGENGPWVREIAKKIALPSTYENGPIFPVDSRWKKGEFDVMISGVGMSDTDPISGATFLFAKAGNNLDTPDGKVLSKLNSAKQTINPVEITRAVRESFKLALEEGLITPICYTTNRHYHSKNVQLNIRDPFAESIRIWEVRLLN